MHHVKWIDKKFSFALDQNELKTVLSKLNEIPGRISELVKNIPEEILIKNVDKKWSIKENIGHLIDLEELHSGRIDDFINDRDTLRSADLNNTKTYQAVHNERDIYDLIAELNRVREGFIKSLSKLDENTLSKTAIHPRLNQPMRPIDMAQFVLEHDKHHLQTIKELVAKFQ
jgi:uncharacterized damage-inducible protein DinB